MQMYIISSYLIGKISEDTFSFSTYIYIKFVVAANSIIAYLQSYDIKISAEVTNCPTYTANKSTVDDTSTIKAQYYQCLCKSHHNPKIACKEINREPFMKIKLKCH